MTEIPAIVRIVGDQLRARIEGRRSPSLSGFGKESRGGWDSPGQARDC